MDNAKKEKKSLKIWVLVILVVLIVALVLFVTLGKNRKAESTEPISYSTDYGDLLYPREWESKSQISVQNGESSSVASFAFIMENGKEIPLFDVIYGSRDIGAYLGDIRSENGDLIPVSIRSYEPDPGLSWSQNDISAYYAMQEDVNFLISQLPLVTDVETGEDILIETEFATLHFPGKWAGQLRTEIHAGSISFYGTVEGLPEYHLFDICFDSRNQNAIGYLETETADRCYVSILINPVEREADWSDFQADQLLTMQENLNYLLSKLELQPVSVENPEASYATDGDENVIIRTPYTDLVYPGKWANYLTTQILEADTYRVTFLANVPDQEPVMMFAVEFGQNVENPIGSFAAETGETVTVTLISQEPAFTGYWSEEEQNLVYAMMEGINTVLEHLPLQEN